MTAESTTRETVIRSTTGWTLDLGELWSYRALFLRLAGRTVLTRYKQTLGGVLWAAVGPFMSIIVFTVLFGRMAKLAPDEGVPYPLMVFTGVLPWQLFAASFNGSTNSLVSNSRLISKIYFPRLILPVSATVVALIDFAVALGVFFLLMIGFAAAGKYELAITWRVLTLPVFVLLAMITALGPGLLLAAMNVRFRDVSQATARVIRMGMLLSPVGYSVSIVSPDWLGIYTLNPMVLVICGFRWALFGTKAGLDPLWVCASLGVMVIVLIAGVLYFRWAERTFADVI
ncbi:MAG: ABC transporter permease [Rhodospirillales bacterium]|nr:ABC transporter permease [Rhodospirillales bacterium]